MHHPSLAALDKLHLPAGTSRRRQFSIVRQELGAALENGTLPAAASHSLHILLDEHALRSYIQVAKTGALRSRLVNGGKPPTAVATNAARLDCLNLIRRAAGLSPLSRQIAVPVEPRLTPTTRQVNALRQRLGDEVTHIRSAGHARMVAVLAVALDTRCRTGELVTQRIDDLDDDQRNLHIVRHPQHGTTSAPVRENISLSPLSRAAMARWLPIRAQLVEQLQGGTTALWVSLSHNHAGTIRDNGQHTLRMPGIPLQQRGLIRSYRNGRHRYQLTDLLPPKPEQLRRALEEEFIRSDSLCQP